MCVCIYVFSSYIFSLLKFSSRLLVNVPHEIECTVIRKCFWLWRAVVDFASPRVFFDRAAARILCELFVRSYCANARTSEGVKSRNCNRGHHHHADRAKEQRACHQRQSHHARIWGKIFWSTNPDLICYDKLKISHVDLSSNFKGYKNQNLQKSITINAWEDKWFVRTAFHWREWRLSKLSSCLYCFEKWTREIMTSYILL